jgi:hypothetical protein
LFAYWYQHSGGNGSRYPIYACPKKREFTVKQHGRIELVCINNFNKLDIFKEFITALFRAKTDRRQKAVNNKLWEFVIMLWTQEEYYQAYSAG